MKVSIFSKSFHEIALFPCELGCLLLILMQLGRFMVFAHSNWKPLRHLCLHCVVVCDVLSHVLCCNVSCCCVSCVVIYHVLSCAMCCHVSCVVCCHVLCIIMCDVLSCAMCCHVSCVVMCHVLSCVICCCVSCVVPSVLVPSVL